MKEPCSTQTLHQTADPSAKKLLQCREIWKVESLQSCKLPSLDFILKPMISKEWIGDHSAGHPFFFLLGLKMAMSQVLSVHFKLIIVHLFQIKPPRLRSEPRVRHLGKSLGVLRKVHWRSCGGQIESSNLSWTLVKIQLTSSSLRLVRLERLPSSTVWTTAGYQSSYPFEHLHFAFIHKMNKTQKNYSKDTEEW